MNLNKKYFGKYCPVDEQPSYQSAAYIAVYFLLISNNSLEGEVIWF